MVLGVQCHSGECVAGEVRAMRLAVLERENRSGDQGLDWRVWRA